MQEMIIQNLSGLVYILITFFYIALVKWISDKKAKSVDVDVNRALTDENNMAFALRRGGLYLAISIAMSGAIFGPSAGLWQDVQVLLLDGLLICIFILIAQQINDKMILSGINNIQALKENNQAVGFTELGAYLATGIIAMASFTGEGGGVLSSLVFFVLGQALLILATRIYEWSTPWSVRQEIAQANTAAGVLLGSVMLAISIAIYGAISGNFNNWQDDIVLFLVNGSIAVVLLIIASKLIDPLFLTGSNVATEVAANKNTAAITIVVAIKIAIAIMINAAVI